MSAVYKTKGNPTALVLKDSQARFFWVDTGSRWVFPDTAFMAKREEIGLHTHVIQFHTPFCILADPNDPDREVIRHQPVMVFDTVANLVLFKLIL